MNNLRVIIASAVLLGFGLPHCAGGLFFASTALAAMPEAVSESQLQSSVNSQGTQDICISYNPCVKNARHHEHKTQCDGCSVCTGQEQYIPARDLVSIKDITSSFIASVNKLSSYASKSENITFYNNKPPPLFTEAREHASTLAMLE